MKKEVIELIQKEKIIAIVRGVDAEHILPTAEALYKGDIHGDYVKNNSVEVDYK